MSPQAMISWTIIYVETYVKLKEGIAVQDLMADLTPFIDEKVAQIYAPGEYVVGLQPITDIHLNAEVPPGLVPVGDRRYIYILSGVALLILLLACINFTTISVGRSVTRSREVGIRKVSGATRTQIMGQFWGEAMLTTFLAVAIGVCLAIAALPLFNSLSGKVLSITFSWDALVWLAVILLLTGLVAGTYPALILSRFQPMQVIRGVLGRKSGDRHIVLRWLVGLQYVISLVLIMCTLVVKDQIRYLQQKDLGYEDDRVVAVPYHVSGQRLPEMWADARRIKDVLSNDLLGRHGVVDITAASHTFGTAGWFKVGYVEQSTDRFRQFVVQQVEPNYLEMMQLRL
ncbi:MAG: FtsX-like permease family protein, partial [Saprospiraceae bacterium]|nr:FtsX-like permease family protein [Saprospiraceae bacterium]